MTAHDDELTTRLNQELHDRVDTMNGSSFDLAGVRGRAHSIRRRRQTIAVVAAAAAIAVIVPTAAVATHHLADGSLPVAPATQSVPPNPSETATASATPSETPSATDETPDASGPKLGVLNVSDLQTGASPGLEYVTDGSVLHRVDGTTADVGTRHPVTGFVSLQDGSRVFLTSDGQRPFVEVADGSGRLQEPVRSGWDLATNPAHTVAAWVDPSGQVRVWNVGADRALTLGDPITAGADPQVATVLGDDCGAKTSSCTVYVNVTDAKGAWQPWEVTRGGSQRLLDGGFLRIADQTESGLTIGLTKVTDSGSCSKLAGGGEFQGWSTCDHTLDAFSPDGSLVVAGPAYRDGIGDGVLAMYDAANGDLLFQRRSTIKAQSFYQSVAWEDDTHVLVPVFQDGRWAMVRISSDGSMDYAVKPVTGKAEENPYTLPTGGVPFGA